MQPDETSTSEELYFKAGVHLWRAVIHRAIEEAEGKIFAFELEHRMRTRSLKERKRMIQRSAQRWLVNDTVFLRRCVEMASFHVEFEVFLEMMKKRFGGSDE